jgi:ABC-type glycerol-3-phosphate transport system substrate-binding protein
MRRPRCHPAALMLAFVVALAAAPSAFAQTWKEVEVAAGKEGAVSLYHNFQPASVERIVAAFNADYPDIKVGEVRLPSGAF